MDSKEHYGPTVFNLSFSKAVKRKLLTDYKVVIHVMSEDDFLTPSLTKDGKVSFDIRLAGFLKTLKKFSAFRSILFYNSVSAAERAIDNILTVTETLGESSGMPGKVTALSINGSMPVKMREKILCALRCDPC